LNSRFNIFISECVYGELEKKGSKFQIALNVIRSIKHNLLKCDHKGTYVDDCIVNRVSVSRCYVIATCDTGLKNRLKKIPSVPLMFIRGYKYTLENMPMY